MLARAVRVTTIRGIEVRLDPSLLVLAVLVAGLFLLRFLDGFTLPVALPMAVVGALLVVATTFAHELAHALEARHRGLEVEAITLLLFGGVTEMHADGQTARDELAIAAVGPYVSLLCGALFGIVATFVPDLLPGALGGPVAEVAGMLGWWNVLLAVFNIVPGAPLDGGRVLRAVLWLGLGDRMRALRISVRAGQALGLGLLTGGLWLPLAGPLPRLPAAIGAVVLATTGWFLFTAARRELRHAVLDEALAGRTVRELLVWVGGGSAALGAAPGHATVTPDDDLHTLIGAFQGRHDVVQVADHGIPLAAVTEGEVARVLGHLRRNGAPPPAPAADPAAASDGGPR